MQKIRIWGWDKKVRTMLRFIKPGDIFCFEFKDESYCFGRIIVKVTTGHLAEILDCVSDKPCIDKNSIEKAQRIGDPIILDSYGLFDRKAEGEWRIIGNQEDYIMHDYGDIYLTFGVGRDWKKVDLYGNTTKISEEEHLKYILMSPQGDYKIKKLLQEHITSLKKYNRLRIINL